jgi:predicted glycosyltransferase
MNREAVALGTPVFTTFEGRLGAVDRGLLEEGRMSRLTDPGELRLEKRAAPAAQRVRREVGLIADLLLSPLG